MIHVDIGELMTTFFRELFRKQWGEGSTATESMVVPEENESTVSQLAHQLDDIYVVGFRHRCFLLGRGVYLNDQLLDFQIGTYEFSE